MDLSGHITINGENGAGKTTLLRLLPLFFGESPSKILRGDENNVKMARYYFPTTASYVVFEYVRRDQKVMAVIHAESQTDKLVYRLIDSAYRPELFRDGEEVVQTGALHRHLEKQGVFDSKALGLHAYRSVIQNTAGREYKHLASRFAFTASTGRLTNIERVVTAILQRVTTFHDLKRMIVSSILDEQDVFSLRTSRKDLLHWASEYEAHYAVMGKAGVMADLDRLDHQRLTIEIDFGRLHACFRVLHEYHREQVALAENDERQAKAAKTVEENSFSAQLIDVNTRKSTAESAAGRAKSDIESLDKRKAHFDRENAEQKMLEVDCVPALTMQLGPLTTRFDELKRQVKSLTQVFDELESDAQKEAHSQREVLQAAQTDAYRETAELKDRAASIQREHLQAIRERHDTERAEAESGVSALRVREAGLAAEVRAAQAEPETVAALEKAREIERAAVANLEALHEGSGVVSRAYDTALNAFSELDALITNGSVSIDKLQDELDHLLLADSAGEDTLLGFLRRNKSGWVGNIGRIIPEESLLRTDLSPSLSGGDDFFGVTLDLERLDVGRFASEEMLQDEIAAARIRLDRKREEVETARKDLAAKHDGLNVARAARDTHHRGLDRAKADKANAMSVVADAQRRVADSQKAATRTAKATLDQCSRERAEAQQRAERLKHSHREEIARIEEVHRNELRAVDQSLRDALASIQSRQTAFDKDLQDRLKQIAKDRDQCLRDHSVSPDVLNGLSKQIADLTGRIEAAEKHRPFVAEYRDWLAHTWPKRAKYVLDYETERASAETFKQEHIELQRKRTEVLTAMDRAIDAAGRRAEGHHQIETRALHQMESLAAWSVDSEVLAAGYTDDLTLDRLSSDRARLQKSYSECRDRIREGVEDIRREMCREQGTGPERFHAHAVQELGSLRHGSEYEWIKVFRTWFNERHGENRDSLVQLGRTMAQNVSYFWKSLRNFKQNVANFSTDLRANLEQGRIFASISDVSTDIRTHVDTQNYWEAVEELHHEYDAWHTQGDALPPASFVAAARKVAEVLSEDKGLIADPVDLISLKISANVNNEGMKTASNEVALANMSSNGLSYIILCVVLIGFVNRIRRKEQVVIPFVIDELKDLSYPNAKTLLELLTRNNITMVSAFPDLDLDLAELFHLNYKIQPGREIALVDKDALLSDADDEIDEEAAYV